MTRKFRPQGPREAAQGLVLPLQDALPGRPRQRREGRSSGPEEARGAALLGRGWGRACRGGGPLGVWALPRRKGQVGVLGGEGYIRVFFWKDP